MRVTAERVRQLDRARHALDRGRITYARWVEALGAWCSGEDVSMWVLGYESIPERIQLKFYGQIVSAEDVAVALELRAVDTAAVALNRMVRTRNQRAQRRARGRFKITGRLS